jgi:zinc protease
MVSTGGIPLMSSTASAALTPVRAVLDNGAVVIVQETVATPAVSINASFVAGSLYEPTELTGLAYLTSRVLDRGTERRRADAIANDLDQFGVSLRIGATRHTMMLTCTCLAEDFEDVLAIVMDVARRPAFPEEELAKRRAESLNVLRQDEDNPAVRAVETLSELLYGPSHPYGRRAKGSADTLERIDRRAMAAFHSENVRPAVLSLVVVGDVDASHAIDRARVELEGWSGAPAGAVIVPPPAADPVHRVRTISMPGKPQADIAYGFTTISRLDPRYYAYWTMNNVLGQFGLGGRLADNIRERQGMAYYAFSSFDPSVGEGPLVVRAGVDPRNVARAIDAIDTEVRQLGENGPTVQELEESRAYLIGSIPRLLETNHSIAGFLQGCEQFSLGLDYDRRLPDLLHSVTISEVASAAAEVLRPERAAVAVAGPPLADGVAR